jgi:hypothetical protein
LTTNKSRLDATLSVATRLQPTARSAGPRQYPRALGETRTRGGSVSRPSFSAKVCMSAPVVPRQSAPCSGLFKRGGAARASSSENVKI